jgi:hypothetical protein
VTLALIQPRPIRENEKKVTDPVETPKKLIRKAERGKDEATPAILIGGMTLVLAIAVAVLLTIAFLVYFLA